MAGEHEHQHPGLERGDLDADPFTQFEKWFDRAAEVSPMPEAMSIATVDPSGSPDARMVLLKGVDETGFRFFTNYEGVKAGQLLATPRAALVFHWVELDRQVRIRGEVQKLEAAESDAYFDSRDRLSRVGAWASPQSQPLGDDRASLDSLSEAAEARFEGVEEIPRPPHWGGYRLVPEAIEFWQGRQGRLHDRFLYTRNGIAEDGESRWKIQRLAP